MALRLDNRPLLGTVDRDLFVPSPSFDAIRRACARDLNILVLGAPGAGKTTSLRALESRADEDGVPVHYVDLGPADNAEQALILIAEALGTRSREYGDSSTRESTTARLLRLVRWLGGVPATRLLVDSPPGATTAFTLFGRLRDELWQLPHRWVVAADAALGGELSRPPASAFFDARFDLEPLPANEQRSLLRARFGGEPGVDIDSLVGRTDGLPRSVVSFAREVALNGDDVSAVVARRDEVRQRLSELPSVAARVVDYLAEHGPTSGSDSHLLSTLDVSAQRARVVLRELESDGLARSFSEYGAQPGRPRKLYELTDAAR